MKIIGYAYPRSIQQFQDNEISDLNVYSNKETFMICVEFNLSDYHAKPFSKHPSSVFDSAATGFSISKVP